MAFTVLNLGLELTIPTNGTRNWGTTVFNTTWTKISQHKHTGSGDGSQIPTAGLEDNAVTTGKLSKNYGVTQATQVVPGGTTQTLDFDLGNTQDIDLDSASGDVTLTLSNASTGASYKIFATQGATPRNLIWPGNVKWPQGQAPILSTANNAIDIIDLYFDGTSFFGGWQVDFK